MHPSGLRQARGSNEQQGREHLAAGGTGPEASERCCGLDKLPGNLGATAHRLSESSQRLRNVPPAAQCPTGYTMSHTAQCPTASQRTLRDCAMSHRPCTTTTETCFPALAGSPPPTVLLCLAMGRRAETPCSVAAFICTAGCLGSQECAKPCQYWHFHVSYLSVDVDVFTSKQGS